VKSYLDLHLWPSYSEEDGTDSYSLQARARDHCVLRGPHSVRAYTNIVITEFLRVPDDLKTVVWAVYLDADSTISRAALA